MRNIRLKPLYLPNDDILVQPPSFLFPMDQTQKENSSKIILNNLDDLKTILRGRRLKSLTARKKQMENEEQEGVVKLSEFKPPQRVGKSPLSRRYTFRRTLSNITSDGGGKILVQSPRKFEDKPDFIFTIKDIANKEKSKTKEIEAEMLKFTENNKGYEIMLLQKINEMNEEIESSGELISKYKAELLNMSAVRQKIEKELVIL